MDRLRLCVLISGRGSNLQSLIDACASPDYPAQIALVIANNKAAGGLARATAAGIATRVVDHRDFETRERFDAGIDAELRAHDIGLVCLAGFMRLLGAAFVEAWHDRLVNIHPALLPSFKGIDAVPQALAAGVKITGCTLHFVRPEMDAGPIIAQTPVPVHAGDDEDTLAARIRQAEHACYPAAVKLIAEGRISVVAEKVVVAES